MMALEKLTMGAWALIPAGVLALADGTMLGQEPTPKAQRNAVSVAPEAKKEVVLVDPLERELLQAARQRLGAQRAYYEGGRITIDRFIMASERLMEVERMVSRTNAERLAASERHLDRLNEVEAREEAELKIGRGTIADVAEAHQNRLAAEVLLKKSKMPTNTNAELSALEHRLSEVERKLDQLLKR